MPSSSPKPAGHHTAIEEDLGSTGIEMLYLAAEFEETLVLGELAKRLEVPGCQSGTDWQQI